MATEVICTNATWSGAMIGLACHLCGHTSLVHPGNHNPGLTTCVICELLCRP